MEFSGGEITELTANIIAESMYAHYDVNGNECLLLEAMITDRMVQLSIEDQKIVVKG